MTDWQAEYDHAMRLLMQAEQDKRHLRLIAEGLRGALERLQTDLRRQTEEHYEERMVRVAAVQAELVKYPLPPELPPGPPAWVKRIARDRVIGTDGSELERMPYVRDEVDA